MAGMIVVSLQKTRRQQAQGDTARHRSAAIDTERKPTKTDWQATASAKGRAIATETNCLRAGQDKA